MATPGSGPPSYPFSSFSQPPSYRSYHVDTPVTTPGAGAAGDWSSSSFLDIDRERLDILVKNFHGSIGVLYSEKNTYHKLLASNIKGYYSTRLSFSGTEIINYDDPSWLDISSRYTHLIFIGVPPTKKRTTRKLKPTSLDAASREEALMSRDNRRLSTVVVINLTVTRGKTEKKGHYLEKFVHLPLQNDRDLTRLAQTAFAIFSG